MNDNNTTTTVFSDVSYTLATGEANLTLTGTNNIYGSGNNADNILTGNDGVNRLNSGRGNDTVYGNGGNDVINGGDGADTLYGGDGNDIINGDNGNDTLYGDNGNDTLNGGAGDDSLNGGAGEDVYIIDINNGHDVISDNEGSNTVRFGKGITPDQITLTSTTDNGTDWLIKIDDNNSLTITNQYPLNSRVAAISTFAFDNASYTSSELAALKDVSLPRATRQTTNATISGTDNDDVLEGTDGNDRIEGYRGDDTIYGLAGNDTLNGGLGSDTIYGGDGDDNIDGGDGEGKDTMLGGKGNDTYRVNHADDVVIEVDGEGIDTVQTYISHTLANNVENLTLLGSANIYGAGNNGDNVITGNSGNNRLNSGRGNDTVYGGDGNDTINGGDGNDKLYGQAGNDTINGDAGDDELVGGLGINVLNGGAGNDTYIVGSRGHDIVRDTQGDNIVKFSASSIDDVSVFTSTNSDGSSDWILFGTNGVATLKNQFTDGSDTPAFNIFEIAGTRYTAQELMEVAGSNGKFGQFVEGGTTSSTLNGTQDNDYIIGGDKIDTIYGHDGDDVLMDKSSLYYGPEHYSDDKLYGGDGNDRIYASVGADYLDGGAGNDYMEGGAHRDTYAFGRGSGQDTIFDFNFMPEPEFQLNSHNANRVLFGEGVNIEDLTLSSSQGYDSSKIYRHPSDESFIDDPVIDGDTWVISIKDSEDSLTILNQKTANGAIAVFEFADGTSYTASEFASKLSEQATAANII